MTEETLNDRIKCLQNMDTAMKFINDEENGVYESWLSVGVPDGASDEDFEEIAKDDESYFETCELFAGLISDLLVNGDWNKKGFSTEFFNVKAVWRGM